MNTIDKFPELIEPLKSNRWIIKFEGVNIPQFLFRKYKIFNEGEDIIFTTEFFETIEYTNNPKDLFKLEKVIIEYLSPVGDVVGGIFFEPKGINFKRKHSYSDDSLMTTKLRIIVNQNTMNTLLNNIDAF